MKDRHDRARLRLSNYTGDESGAETERLARQIAHEMTSDGLATLLADALREQIEATRKVNLLSRARAVQTEQGTRARPLPVREPQRDEPSRNP